MKRTVYHVAPSRRYLGSKWLVKREGGLFMNYFRTKEEAITFARRTAHLRKPSQVKVHKLDGKIEIEWTYENDPVRYIG